VGPAPEGRVERLAAGTGSPLHRPVRRQEDERHIFGGKGLPTRLHERLLDPAGTGVQRDVGAEHPGRSGGDAAHLLRSQLESAPGRRKRARRQAVSSERTSIFRTHERMSMPRQSSSVHSLRNCSSCTVALNTKRRISRTEFMQRLKAVQAHRAHVHDSGWHRQHRCGKGDGDRGRTDRRNILSTT
jgi:hypothetical protein